MKRYLVELEAEEREALAAITRKGSHRSQKVVNALVLLNCDEGEFNERRTTGRETAGVLRISAKKNAIKPSRRVGWAIPPQRNADFAAGMERVLDGRPAKTYEYRRPPPSACNLFVATEPLAGWRPTRVTESRTRTDWARFLRDIAGRRSWQAGSCGQGKDRRMAADAVPGLPP